jgi:acyl-coenzyme A synthetase/AMP-(fatty) acid ligase/acyl carrier protein
VDRFLLLSSYSFDSSVAGIFWTLTQGGTLVLPEEGATLDLSEIENTIIDRQITHTLSIPSLYEALLQQRRDLGPLALRVMIVAGEGCPMRLYECHRRTLPGVAFYNEYGPTETTVWATVAAAGETTQLNPIMPIGRPIPNMDCLVLDAFGDPTPIGVAGELCLAGRGLAHGLLGAADLTADRFVPNPYSDVPGGRMYRTGDLVRWLDSGSLDFLGRMDSQVKVNGFRVELGEIETVLNTHPQIQRAIVQVRPNSGGTERLIAYVLARDTVQLAADELAKFARERLPKYMLPAQYVQLATLPTTPSGKLDRKALPEPPADRAASPVRAPRTPTEDVLSGIWSEVLGVNVVSVDRPFFDLGGESLRAMRIMARVQNAFDVRLPINLLMTNNSTVEQVAEVIEVSKWARTPAEGSQQVVGTI